MRCLPIPIKASGVRLEVADIAMPATSAIGTKLPFNKACREYRSEGVKSGFALNPWTLIIGSVLLCNAMFV